MRPPKDLSHSRLPPTPPPSGVDGSVVEAKSIEIKATLDSALEDDGAALARFDAELDLVDINARQLARRLGVASRGGSITLDDLRSFGREGLLQATRSYDATRGVPFRRWANLRIRGAMIDGMRQWGSLPRRLYRELRGISAADATQEAYDEEDAANPATTPAAADARLTTYLAGLATAYAMGGTTVISQHGGRGSTPSDAESVGHDETPEELYAQAELLVRLREAVARLPQAERTLVERHYFGGETLEHAAASLGLSKSWGSRLHARAVDAIARDLRRTVA